MPESIGDAEQALDRVAKLAPALAAGASERDRDRRLPRAEIAALSDSGLLTITVPRRFGGPGLGATVLARVVAALAAAD
ncbi:acyl-CoA dehydrogenase family protein, partial [Gordonia sp. (in: high G+C Gram-positive bacteria)]|uniref:acyl-CoA dehydrogenase family protein n=1 Tax=Gordonia sp. (in: high G+C Gram-positive bacteria) TaxID=84139 RepID=UPI00263003E7